MWDWVGVMDNLMSEPIIIIIIIIMERKHK